MTWACDTCGAPGLRDVAARGYCATHLAELYRTLDPAVWEGQGIGLPVYADVVECVACGATWVGPAFEQCGYCLRALQRMRAWQAQMVLRPPDVDADDEAYPIRMAGWAARMARGVEAGLISQRQMTRAWSHGKR